MDWQSSGCDDTNRVELLKICCVLFLASPSTSVLTIPKSVNGLPRHRQPPTPFRSRSPRAYWTTRAFDFSFSSSSASFQNPSDCQYCRLADVQTVQSARPVWVCRDLPLVLRTQPQPPTQPGGFPWSLHDPEAVSDTQTVKQSNTQPPLVGLILICLSRVEAA